MAPVTDKPTELMMARMDAALDHPWRDPHGDPIPTTGGVVHQPVARLLGELEPGEGGCVARIGDDDADLLVWFANHGIDLDVQLRVVESKPFGGPLVTQVADGPRSTIVEFGIQAIAALWMADEPPRAEGGWQPGCPYPHCRHLR